MNFNNITKEIERDQINLRPILLSDSRFIDCMFEDEDIKRYYIVPKEAQQDYKRLVRYWLNDIRNGAGTCWIITQKENGLLFKNKQVGFVAFEFRDSLKKARISYAILPEYRGQGIATAAVEMVIDKLKDEGVEKLEADIDRDNYSSEKVVEKLGFNVNKKQALVDPEMFRDGDVRMRALWYKDVFDFSKLEFYYIDQDEFSRLINNATIYKVWEEEKTTARVLGNMLGAQPTEKTGRYHFVFQTDVTEKLVGISDDDSLRYNIPWELLREEQHNGKKILIFCGWGDPKNGIGSMKFDYYEIGIDKMLFANLLAELMSNYPDFFSEQKMRSVIGLEGFRFEEGQIGI
ncbi:GNAT family N-acetyltransferase [Marinifilum flexuosum]|uniref:RimJ/RimL family protein N-acetyltransferase n=1 Tax=Marinifilum flexuosum TaxID=1117708 RepID=A0A419X9K2_9BACT|nr:GNAT family N-acetyltransferase [Marinifilum flexuosum]RKE04444.1 RimJ/RimL family protein N-acetyltransferase [Marinifilum flexuosum]